MSGRQRRLPRRRSVASSPQRDFCHGVTDEMIDKAIARLGMPGEDSLTLMAELLCVGRRAVPQLVAALPYNWEVVRLRIVWLLGESLDCRAIEPLQEVVRHGSYPLRRCSRHALQKIYLHHGLLSINELSRDVDDEMLRE